MLKLSLCFYRDTYRLIKGTIKVIGRGTNQAARQADEIDKELTFKNCTPFTDCIS